METVLIKALQLVLALSILVIVHEFGHFIFARIFKVRVEKFYLFFNPWFSLFKFKPKKSDTEYGIGWLPLGGYVKIAGMIDESMDKDQMSQPAKSYEFRAKGAFPRLMIMIGGVLFNFILAMVIYAAIAYHWGETYLPLKNAKAGMEFSQVAQQAGFKDGDIILAVDGVPMELLNVQTIGEAKNVTVLRNGSELTLEMPVDFMQKIIASNTMFASEIFPLVIKEVTPKSSAEKAGLIANDSVVAVNNIPTLSQPKVSQQLALNKGKEIELSFYRNGELMQLPVMVNEDGMTGVRIKNVSEMFNLVTKKYSFFEAIPAGISKGIDRLVGYVSSLKYIFTKEGAQSLGGFVAIGNIFPSVWNWYDFWNLLAFLSIMLGFMNILPIPALDGGHVLFLLYEIIARRKPSEKFMEYAQITGMVILFGLVIFANGNDLFKLFFK
ncbi:MAG: RIP metalloprotease RseP [Bacteroidales bacterium]|nr:RIP metalloprotease RseP [Bacteroidales bacterium]